MLRFLVCRQSSFISWDIAESCPLTRSHSSRFRKGSEALYICCFFLIGLAIHIAFNITLLTKRETAITRLNIIDNSPYGTTKQFRESISMTTNTRTELQRSVSYT